MWYPYHGFGWAWMIAVGLMMILFWGGLIALVVWLFRASTGATANRSPNGASQVRSSGEALDVLKERYARGEISKAQYEQKRDDLRA
jgi:putative membrane protein